MLRHQIRHGTHHRAASEQLSHAGGRTSERGGVEWLRAVSAFGVDELWRLLQQQTQATHAAVGAANVRGGRQGRLMDGVSVGAGSKQRLDAFAVATAAPALPVLRREEKSGTPIAIAGIDQLPQAGE